MIVELLVLLLAWAGRGVILTLISGVPLLFSIPLVLVILIVYDFMARPERELSEGRE
jgi:hypothetical protein